MKVEDVKITRMFAESNKDYLSESTKVNVEMSVGISLGTSTIRHSEGMVSLDVQVFDLDFQKKNKPFHIHLTITGRFTEEKENVPQSTIKRNATLGMLPHLRTHLEYTFASMGYPDIKITPDTFEELLKYAESK